MKETTESLLILAREGNRRALHTLLEEWRPTVLAIARRELRHADDAQDLTQNALIYLSLRLPVGSPDQAAAYVRRVALSQCVDFWRRRATRRSATVEIEDWQASYEDADPETRMVLVDSLDALPQQDREAFLMHYVGGYDHAEAAAMAEVEISTFRSRLQSAKRRLRASLSFLHSLTHMDTNNEYRQLVATAFPGATIQKITENPESWLPIKARMLITLDSAETKLVDVRNDITPDLLPQLKMLAKAQLPFAKVHGQIIENPAGGWLCLADALEGENLSVWAMDGTYHRFRTVSDISFSAISALQALTEDAKKIGVPAVSLADYRQRLEIAAGPWRDSDLFRDAVSRLDSAESLNERSVFTNHTHYFPNFMRIKDGSLAGVVSPYGVLADPLMDLAMVWIYDCYPVVHTGFVEQYLVKHNISRREFGYRLALRTLLVIVQELPVDRPQKGAEYWDNLTLLLKRGVDWMED